MNPSSPAEEPKLVLTRIFDAPRELVWKVWTNPKHIVNWWGPHGFTAPVCTADLRPGGSFHYCMRSADGQDFWCKGTFHEIIAPERIVSTIHFSDKDGGFIKPTAFGLGPEFPEVMEDTIIFEVHAGTRTKLTLHRNTPLSISKRYMEDQGWGQSLDKFAAEVARANGAPAPLLSTSTESAATACVTSGGGSGLAAKQPVK